MLRSPRIGLLALLVSAASPVALAEPTPDEARLLARANEERRDAGAAALRWDEDLAGVARAHAADMLLRGDVSHDSLLDGGGIVERLAQAGLRVARVAENVALAPDVERAHLGFMDSAGHRANLLDPAFLSAGFGVVEGEAGLFIVQDFSIPAAGWTDERAGREVLARVLDVPRGGRLWAWREDEDLTRAMEIAVRRMALADEAFASSVAHDGCWMMAYVASHPDDVPDGRVPSCVTTRAGAAAIWARTPTRRLGAWFVAIALAP